MGFEQQKDVRFTVFRASPKTCSFLTGIYVIASVRCLAMSVKMLFSVGVVLHV